MFKYRFQLFAIMAVVISMSISASDISENSYTEPSYAVYAGYSGTEVTVSGFNALTEIVITVTDMEAFLTGAIIENLDKLKPDKDHATFNYTVIKPTKLAVMQNSNFDRVAYI